MDAMLLLEVSIQNACQFKSTENLVTECMSDNYLKTVSNPVRAEKGVSYQTQVMSPTNLISVKETSQTITEKSGEKEGWLVLVFCNHFLPWI